MSKDSPIRAILALHTEKIGSKTLFKLKQAFGDYDRASVANLNALKLAGLSEAQLDSIKQRAKILDRLNNLIGQYDVKIVQYDDSDYPLLLKELPDPPAVLYCRGQLPQTACVSIVGSRKSTSYGTNLTQELARTAAKLNLTVVSGLALGIDSAAHRAIVEAHGRTVGVLACGLEQVYPPSHRQLAEAMVASGGGLISEFPLLTPSYPGNFPIRNRIIAGLSRLTIVTEAGLDSGALLTAGLAIEYNRDLFAVPGDINRPTSAGTNALLRMGATPLVSSNDIADYFGFKDEIAEPVPLSSEEGKIVEAISFEGTHIDKIAQRLKLDIQYLGSIVVMLEIKGALRHEGAGVYRRVV